MHSALSLVSTLAVWLDEKLVKMRLIALGTVLTDVRDVTEKRLLHRVFIATQSPNRIWTWSYELSDGKNFTIVPDGVVARKYCSILPY